MHDHPYTRDVRTFPVPPRALFALSVVLTLLAPAAPVAAAPVVRTPTDPRTVVELRSDADGRVWRGHGSIAFTNADADPLHAIHLRLWSNGIAGCDTLAIRVRGVTGGTPDPLAQRCTTLQIELDSPVGQGERGRVEFRLVIRVPLRNDRFGHAGGLSALGSALPALAVKDDRGWNLPPFVDLGESFYSVTGTYRITLDTPRRLVTPTTGTRVARRAEGRRVTSTYVARNVRDFEWAAGRLRQVAGTAAGTRVAVSYVPAAMTHAEARRVWGHAARSMRTFTRAFGPYPYPEVDVVLTGFASFAGMEYPTLVFSNSSKLTVAHELAHQWWYGLVGNDQFSEPWLDEGFATWSQRLPWHPWRRCRGISWPSASARLANDMAYWRSQPGEYGHVVYHGGGCLLAQLADGLGLPRFLRTLERYADRHRYGIVRTADFRRTIERVADRHWPGFPANFWSRWRVGP